MSFTVENKSEENITKGDLIYIDNDSIIRKADTLHSKMMQGVVADIIDNELVIATDGLVDVNVCGTICLGDHLTVSDKPGFAEAISELLEEDLFDIRQIGKVVGLYNKYSKAKVLLNIK